MTILEDKLIRLFRACPDELKIGILDTALSLSGVHDETPVSLASALIDAFPDSLSDKYKARLLRHSEELVGLQSGAEESRPSAPIPDPVPRYLDSALVKTAQRASVPTAYQMTLPDIDTLYKISNHDPFQAFCFAFDYGFVKGNRATRRGKVKAL